MDAFDALEKIMTQIEEQTTNWKILLDNASDTWSECRDYQKDAIETYLQYSNTKRCGLTFDSLHLRAKCTMMSAGIMLYQLDRGVYGMYTFTLEVADKTKEGNVFLKMTRTNGTSTLVTKETVASE